MSHGRGPCINCLEFRVDVFLVVIWMCVLVLLPAWEPQESSSQVIIIPGIRPLVTSSGISQVLAGSSLTWIITIP